MSSLGVFVPVSVVFPEVNSDIDTFICLLSSLSRTDVLFWCARLNYVVTGPSNRSHIERQSFGVQQLLTRNDARRIDCFAQEHSGEITVFFRGSLLELLRWAVLVCDDHASDGMTFESAEVRETFAKTALIASDIWGKRVYGEALSLDDGVSAARERSLGPFRKGVEAGLVAPELAQSLGRLGRGWQIFQSFLPSVDASFASRFNEAVGLTVEEYYACWCACVSRFMTETEATIFDANTIGQNTEDLDLVRRFIALESQTAIELRQALWGTEEISVVLAKPLQFYDYKPLREKPFLQAPDGRTIIIDASFVVDKVAVGPLFHVIKHCPAIEVNGVFAAFGKAFEKYIQDMLRRAFPSTTKLFDRLSCGLEGRCAGKQFELDACLNYVNDLILFEIKAAWPQEDKLTPENTESLLQLLRRQYGISNSSEKGAAQLAKIANAIASREWVGSTQEFQQVNRIIPVLVVHDVLLGAPGFGNFVVNEFDSALGPCEQVTPGERLKGTVRVLAPIVLTVEDVEMLEVSTEHFGLREALLDYSDACRDRMTSFHSFVATSAKYSGHFYANRHLALAAIEALKTSIYRLFGPAASE